MAATLEMLTEAETALHRLQLGQAVVELRDQNGETIRYQQTNRGALTAYIEELKRELGITSNCATGPMRVWL